MSVPTQRATAKVQLPEDFVKQMVAKAAGAAGPQAPAEVPVSQRRAPQVTAILVVNDLARLRFARAAVNNFVRQTYVNKHLVIVNGIDPATYPAEETVGTETVTLTDQQRAERSRVITRDHPWITEVPCDPGLTTGLMRNIALDHSPASGRWAILWEDDVFSHQTRIAFQMAHRIDDDSPVLLRREVRVDVVNHVAVPYTAAAGIHSTLLFPVGNRPTIPAFPDTTGYDAAEFWIKNWGGDQIAIPNEGEFPQPVMQVAFWHGRNALTRPQFLGEYADSKWYKKAAVSPEELKYLSDVVGPVMGANFSAAKPAQPG
jgi:hypothetical protein